uniref:Ig-like domain-containing protein n=1 Tax=Lates calcarifer TaxID=8187 RepID=A0A4W6FAP6_LATCA
MLAIIHILLVINIGRCTDDYIFETKTVDVGDNVTLTCPRQRTGLATDLFWIRLVSGTFPEVLGGMIASDYKRVKKTHHMTAKQELGLFVLHFSKTQISDTAIYYCIKVKQHNMTFLKGIFLRIKGPESAVTQDFLSDPVHPGDSVTLQCSVLSDSEKKTCLEDHHVYWFRAGSDQSHPSLIYAHGNHSDTCEEGPEVHSPQKCVYSFSKNVSSSDAGTYYCAVATCGEIIFGNGTKLDIEGNCTIFLYNEKVTTIF